MPLVDDEDLFDAPRPKPSNKIVYQPPGAQWSLDRLPEVESLYQTTFKKRLPLTNRGQGSIHNRWGYDHRNSADVSINPSTPEGQQFIEGLKKANVPFLAFSSAIPGVATGPHIHIGFPSKRTQQKFNVGAQKKSKSVASDDLFDTDDDLFDQASEQNLPAVQTTRISATRQPPVSPKNPKAPSAPIKLPTATSRVIDPATGEELKPEKPKPIEFVRGGFPDSGERLTGIEELKRHEMAQAPPQSQILSREYTANLGHEGGNQHSLSRAALRALGLNEQLGDLYAEATGRPLLSIANAQPDRQGNFRFTMPKQTVDFLNAWAAGLAAGGVEEGLRRAAAVNLAGREDVRQSTEAAQQAAAQSVTEAKAATQRGVESPFIRGVTSGAAPVAQAIGTVLPESLGDFERKARVLRAAGEQADIERPLTGTGEQIKAGLGAAVPTAMEFAVTGPLKAAQLPVLGALGGFTPEERVHGALQGAVTHGTFALPGMLAPNITGTAQKALAGGTMAAVPATEAAIRGGSIPRAIAESLPYAALPFLHKGSEPEKVQRVVPERVEGNVAQGEVKPSAEAIREGAGRAASPDVPVSERSTASVKAFITRADEAALRSRGYSQEDIYRMKPAEAQRILETPAEGPAGETASPQRFYHKDWGEVVRAEDQTGARKGRTKVYEEADPTKIHYPKTADLRGRGNERMVPVRSAEKPESESLLSDESGEPLTLYHHTTKEAKDAILKTGFDLSKGRARLSDEAVPDGVFFTPSDKTPFRDPDIEFARIDANLDAKNPLRVQNRDEIRQWASERDAEYAQITKELSKYTFDEMGRLYEELQGTDKAAAQRAEQELQALNEKATRGRAILTNLLKRDGYDSLIMERDEAGPQVTKTYVVLDPKQVRIKGDMGGAPEVSDSATKTSAEMTTADPEMIAPVRETVQSVKETEGEGRTTSLRKAQMAADRAALDLSELPEAQRKSWRQSLDNARSKGLDRKADVLANEVLQQPRALNDEESAGLVLRAQELKNEHARVMREIGEATDAGAIKAKTAERDAIEASFDKVSRAAKLSGTEKARALTTQKLTINQDYDLVSVISRAKAAKGRDLTAPERAQYEELVTKYKALEDQLAELRTQQEAKSSQQTVDKFVREQSVSLRRQRRQRTTETLKAERADLKNQISALVRGASVKEFFKSEKGEFDPKHTTELTRLLTALARNYIESGVVKAEALVDAVHSEIKDVTELTRREVSDLISGYGQIRKPSSDPVERKLTELKAILAATSGRVDVLEKSMRPLRRGQQREKPTEDQRRALRDLQDAMREKGPDLAAKRYDSSREQATPLDKAKTTARNRIEQLRKWIDEGKKEVQGQKRVIPDAELTQLRAERDALEKAAALLDDPVADQRTIERRVSALEQSIKATRERIASGQLQPDVKEGRATRWSREIGELERERRALRRILSDMKRDSARQQREQERSKSAGFYGAEKTWAEFEAEAKRTLNRRRHLEKRLSELEQQLASGNIEAPQPRPERMPTEDEFRLERRITDAKRKIEERLSNDGETSLGRLARRVGDVLGLYRAIETSFDVSWALRQGKIGLARHPTFWSKAFIEQFKGLSNDKYFRAAKEIENDPDFRYLNKFGLETPSVDSIHAGSPTYTRAEEFQTELAHKIPGLRQSEQVYNIGLDTLKVMWAKHDLQMLRKAGFNPEKPSDFKVFKEAMQSINDATGRTSLGRLIPGKVGEAANRATPAINQLTYAVRFWASRLKVLSLPLDPRMYPQPEFAKRYYESLPRVQRVEAWKRLFAFYGLWGGQAAAMKYLLGFDLELDPDSPDFGKFRRGNRVYDFSAGMVNHLRFAARMAKRVYEAKTGQEPKSSAVDTLGTYLRSKESPVAGRVHDIFLSKQTKEGYGTDFKGDPVYPFGKPDSGFFGRLKTARLLPKPLGLDDAMEAYDQMGWGGVAGSVPASVLGEGVQTYPKKENKQLKRRQTREKMTGLIRRGEPIDIDGAVSAGELTESDRKQVLRDVKLTERQARFADFQPATALDRFERMDESQREEVRDQMEKKAYTLLHSDSLTQQQKDGFAARIDALGITPQNPRSNSSGGFRSRLKGFKSAFREAP